MCKVTIVCGGIYESVNRQWTSSEQATATWLCFCVLLFCTLGKHSVEHGLICSLWREYTSDKQWDTPQGTGQFPEDDATCFWSQSPVEVYISRRIQVGRTQDNMRASKRQNKKISAFKTSPPSLTSLFWFCVELEAFRQASVFVLSLTCCFKLKGWSCLSLRFRLYWT